MFLLILMMESQQQKSFHTLNSIMFLLIRYHLISIGCLCLTLNSIMFLLIRDCGIYCSFVKNFKFHYVSINSTGAVLDGYAVCDFKFHYVSINSLQELRKEYKKLTLNSIMFLLIPVPKPTAYLLHEIPLFCRPLQNISFLSHSSSYVLATPPILAIFYFCRFPAFFTLSQVDRNHYIFIISSFLLA